MKVRRSGASRNADQSTGHDSMSERDTTSQRGCVLDTIVLACTPRGAVTTRMRLVKMLALDADRKVSTSALEMVWCSSKNLVWMAHSPPP